MDRKKNVRRNMVIHGRAAVVPAPRVASGQRLPDHTGPSLPHLQYADNPPCSDYFTGAYLRRSGEILNMRAFCKQQMMYMKTGH